MGKKYDAIVREGIENRFNQTYHDLERDEEDKKRILEEHPEFAEIPASLSPYILFKNVEHLRVLETLNHKIIGLFTGNQAGKCLTSGTLIHTPDGEVSIGELYSLSRPFDVWAWDGEKSVISNARPPIKKQGLHACYRLEMSDGRVVEMADYHRILTRGLGYAPIEGLLCTCLRSLPFSSISMGTHPATFSALNDSLVLFNGNQVTSCTFIGSQEVYDFEVPGYHNYIASDMVHHNTSCAAHNYVKRILGIHPIAEKNRLSRNIRCLGSTLPESADADEQKNTQYLELKKLLPYESILKDITSRSATMTISSPVHGKSYVEFVSTKQDVQDTGRVQRCSLWCDEEPSKPHYEESRMRLLARGGDTIITLTPVNGLSWTYDEIWTKASLIYRSKVIAKLTGQPRVERIPEGDRNIACVQIATDDNPTLNADIINSIFESVDDPDDLMVRRYGIFKQITGRVHKSYNRSIHYIDFNKYFPDGIPYDWTHARGIDYHESRTPWSIGWLSVSPENEAFLWQEFHPAIDGPRAMNTYEICKAIARKSGDYYFTVNLIDPLANKKQANTLFSVTDDLNRMFEDLHRNHGLGTQSYWQGWDTKDTKGRNEVKMRLKNALKIGRPFANAYREHGEKRHLPTLWICNTCPKTDESIRKWSYQEWATTQSKAVNDSKPTPQQRYSHDNMVLECLFKDFRLVASLPGAYSRPTQHKRFGTTGRPIHG